MKKKLKEGVRIEVPLLRLNHTGTTLMSYADRYREATLVLLRNSPPKKQFDPVPYFLLCLSLELQLKAFIWLKGGLGTRILCGNKTIKTMYGHNIEKLWYDSKVHGINRYARVTPLRDNVIALVGSYYKKRQFNYVDVEMIFSGFKKIRAEPEAIATLDKLTKQLSKSLRTPILRVS